MLLASKIAAALVLPLNLSILLGLVALVMARRRRGGLAAAFGLLALAILVTASLPVVSDALVFSLEREYPPADPGAAPTAGAIVVLGGSLAPGVPPRRGPELVDSSDRILHASRLYRAGKAPLVVPSGGRLPWSVAARSEAAEIADLLVEWGVPRAAIVEEPNARTTSENAVELVKLLRARGVRRVLLVTSSLHMRRALASFRAEGLEAIPSPCDALVVSPKPREALDWIPRPVALEQTHAALWEYLGLAYYRVTGRA
ncbi:MAG: YdcF family protein [Holophagales bacterium]|nr:YdcF family protein [Holophagales bacterium]